MKARPSIAAARSRFVTTAVALIAGLALALSGCGSGSGSGGHAADTELTAVPQASAPAPAPGAKVIAVTVNGSTVTPSGVRVQVKSGQPVVFQITADVAGELHVHSTPAKAISYPAGKSQVQITIDQPGLIEAEIEQLGKLVVELEVS